MDRLSKNKQSKRTDRPPPPPIPNNLYYTANINIIEQYVGVERESVAIYGGNYYYLDYTTSCDLSVAICELWIIYGTYYEGNIYTGYCSHSNKYAASDGEIDYKYNRAINSIKLLREKYKKRKVVIYTDGVHDKYLDGNKLRLSESYTDGLLDGPRTAFFPNKNLMLEENYKKGQRHGNYIWFDKDGTIDESGTYNEGIVICERYIYDDEGNLYKIHYYDDEGEFIVSESR